jgi:enoyl-CoA hydratase/carnithine racemase
MSGKKDRRTPEEMVLYEKDPATKIATITLDRPEALNATTIGARHRFADLVQRANIDDDVKVLVIRGEGPHLGSGADLEELFEAKEGDGSGLLREFRLPQDGSIKYPPKDSYRFHAAHTQQYANVSTGMRALQEFKKISILEVKGYCYGWHFYQAADCDLVVSSDEALFGHASFRYAGWAARQWQWISMMGLRKFSEMVFTGRPFSAKEMYDCGFVNAVVPLEDLEATTAKYALACSRSRPVDTVFAQKVFFEIYKQHQGEYMGSMLTGMLESLGHFVKNEDSAHHLNEELWDKGLTQSVRDNDEQFPPDWRLSLRGRNSQK